MTSVEVLKKRRTNLERWITDKKDDIGFDKLAIENKTKDVSNMEKEVKDIENAIVRLEKK